MSERSATLRVSDPSPEVESIDSLERRARVARDVGDYETAINCYRKAILEAPMRADLRNSLAMTLHEGLEGGRRGPSSRGDRVLPKASVAPVSPHPIRRAADVIETTGAMLDRAFEAASSRLLRPTPPRDEEPEEDLDVDGGTLRFDDPLITPPPSRRMPPPAPRPEQGATVRTASGNPVQRIPERPRPAAAADPLGRPLRPGAAPRALGAPWRPRLSRGVVAAGIIASGLLLVGAGVTHSYLSGWLQRTAEEFDAPASTPKRVPVPEELNAVLTLANERVMSGKPSDAVSKLRAARMQFPNYTKTVDDAMIVALKAEGTSLARRKDYQHAAKSFQNVADIDPANMENWILLGRVLRDQARTREKNPQEARKLLTAAENAFRRVLQQQPRNTAALFGLAQVYVAQGDRRRAMDAYHDVMESNPTSDEARMATLALKQLVGDRVRDAKKEPAPKKK